MAMASSFLLWMLLAVGSHGLFIGLLILAVLAAILLPPYLLGLVVDVNSDISVRVIFAKSHLSGI